MEYRYCKYCGHYKKAVYFSHSKRPRCKACERHAKDRFDPHLELELSYKAEYFDSLHLPAPKRAPSTPELIAKRRKRQELLDLQAIDEEYAL